MAGKRRTSWKDLVAAFAPSHFEAICSSAEVTLSLIHHEDSSVRTAALIAAHAIWGLGNDTTFMQECCRVAVDDTIEDPRLAAVEALGLIFGSSKDRVVQRCLAKVVLDSSATNFLRNSAYRAMRHVQDGVQYEELLPNSAFATEIQSMIDKGGVPLTSIDWQLVKSKIDDDSVP